MADPLSRDGGSVHHSADPPETTAGQISWLQRLTSWTLSRLRNVAQHGNPNQSKDKRTRVCEAGFRKYFDVVQDTSCCFSSSWGSRWETGVLVDAKGSSQRLHKCTVLDSWNIEGSISRWIRRAQLIYIPIGRSYSYLFWLTSGLKGSAHQEIKIIIFIEQRSHGFPLFSEHGWWTGSVED